MLGLVLGPALTGTRGPGDHGEAPLWLTVPIGIGGMLLGDWLYTLIWDAYTPGVDWWRHAWQLGTALLLVLAVCTVGARRRTR